MPAQGLGIRWTWLLVVFLLVVMAAQLALSARRESQTFDEAAHLYAGYSYWKHADFGRNPEHPPLVKLLAALPLVGKQLIEPTDQNRGFKIDGFISGRNFVYGNGGDRLLFPARMAASLLTLALALVVFLAAREMFGEGAGFVALLLVAFEPNLLAHGALVTTDVGVALFLLLTVYLFYRYVKSPSWMRLGAVGIAAGLTLAAKHSGVLVFPMLLLLSVCEVIRGWRAPDEGARTSRRQLALRYLGSMVVIGMMAVAILWAFYGFRYNARPGLEQLRPSLAASLQELKPGEARALSAASRMHALPEAYIYGLSDVRQLPQYIRSYAFGTVYPHGVWFYFPATLVVKSTLAFLALLAICKLAIVTRRFTRWREILFLAVPAALYLLVAMGSGLNLGVRHILSVYVFLAVLVAGAAWSLVERNRRWAYVVGALLVFHAVSSLHAFPSYIAYSNEAFGGPAKTYKALTDSSVDWGQQLKSVKSYLDQRQVHECWFAYLAQTAVEPSDYGIPCKPLPVVSSLWLGEHMRVPASIDGPVLISASILSGYHTGAGALNPYDGFNRVQPTAVIDNGVLVFDGHFDVSLVSAITHTDFAYEAITANRLNEALAEAQTAVSLAPDDVASRYCLGAMLEVAKRPAEAREQYAKALELATTVNPEFQVGWAAAMKRKLGVQ